MAELILYKGSAPITITPREPETYLYRIGPGQVRGGNFIDLNDAELLNQVAEQIRDDYSEWVYQLNDLFTESNLIVRSCSLFFLSDLSCKRAEFFETYNLICNLFVLRQKLSSLEITAIRVVGFDRSFITAIKSEFGTYAIRVENPSKPLAAAVRRLLADAKFFSVAIAIRILWLRLLSADLPSSKKTRAFLSFFPQMFNDQWREEKFGSLISEADEVAVFLLSDGMHQRPQLRGYVQQARAAMSNGFEIIDRFLKWTDLWEFLRWSLRLWTWYPKARKQIPKYSGMDISEMIAAELRFSVSRLSRLMLIKGPVSRFLEREKSLTEVYYYPVEYPIGRMISWVAATVRSDIRRVGVQMSIVSPRRLEQFMAQGEAATAPPFVSHAPIPDRVLAEDDESASIYCAAGYQNVGVMEHVYRYEYLKGTVPTQRGGYCLIAPGLHDGRMMMEVLSDKIARSRGVLWILKPHPRADSRYLDEWKDREHVQISSEPVARLLGQVEEVFVTYSSVGIEASKLGIQVHVIDIPGHVNTSPLSDAVRK